MYEDDQYVPYRHIHAVAIDALCTIPLTRDLAYGSIIFHSRELNSICPVPFSFGQWI
jgi:hypothetical protein